MIGRNYVTSANKHVDRTWALLIALLVLVLSVPVLTILFKFFEGPGESWGHIVEHLLADYLLNSLFLVVVSGTLALVLGVVPAWLLSRYEFPFRRTLEWTLILPLAIPNYLTASAYAGFFDYSGPFQNLIIWITGVEGAGKIDFMHIWGLAVILAVSLYPYVYVTTRSFFLNQSGAELNSAILLGSGEFAVFWRIALPMARPAVAGGLFLVLMEVLNDYGAAHYFGINTFTTAIFRSWFSLEEPDTSVYLAALLCLFVFGLVMLERYQRRRKGYQFRSSTVDMARLKPTTGRQLLLLLACCIPLLLGFLLPLFQMGYWGMLTAGSIDLSGIAGMIGSSFLLASLTALICISVSYLLIYGSRWSKSRNVMFSSRIAVLGYAVPGVVIAVGILIPSLVFDKWLVNMMQTTFGQSIGFLINGTIIGLLFAYCVRFLAVSHNPIEANVKKLGPSLGHASQILGASKWRRTFEVNLPLLNRGLLSGAILVFVDVMKELPLTLLLKPYGVMTLATKAYEYASDERIAESAVPSLIIIAVGVLPIILLNKLLKK